MNEVVALSFDSDATPRISLRTRQAGAVERASRAWGLAWYPASGEAAVVNRDPEVSGVPGFARTLEDFDRFHSTVFVSALRLADEPLPLRDAQPFQRAHGGRHWLFVHAGDLGGVKTALPLDEAAGFDPVGRTASEHAFCWLLGRLRQAGARSLAEIDPGVLHRWLLQLNESGTASFVVSDGQQVAVYRDAQQSQGLYWLRRVPPHGETHLESFDVSVDLDAPRDPFRTVVVAATYPMSREPWLPMEGGQLLLVRRAALVWSSHPDPSIRGFWSVPALRAGGVAGPQEGAVQGQALLRADRAPVAEARVAESRTLTVFHETIYRYEVPVERSSHRFRLRPAEDRHQQLLDFELTISVDGDQHEFEDVFGNHVTSFEISRPFDELVLRSRARVRVLRQPLQRANPAGERVRIPVVWMPWQRQMMSPYLLPPELPESQLRELTDFATSFAERNDHDLLETLLDVNRTLHRDFSYVAGSTTVATSPFEVYMERRGVCQDFANLMICVARLLHVPARYRMGYIHTGSDYANRVQSEASHAWVELYLPRIGWTGFDPTNGCTVQLDHVRVAVGRNYLDATPTSGTIYKGGGAEVLTAVVQVEREADQPGGIRPDRPIS